MEHLAALMLIIACNSDGSACREVPAPSVGYEVMQDCLADRAPVLAGLAAAGDQVVSHCVAIDPLTEGDLTLTWDFTEDGDLVVTVEAPDQPRQVSVAALAPSGKQSRLQ